MKLHRWAVLALLVAVFAVGAVAKPKPEPPPPAVATPSLDNVLAGLPATTRVFVGLDLRDRLTMAQVMQSVEEFLKAHPALQEQYEQFLTGAGISPRELIGWASPVAFMAMVPSGNNQTLFETPDQNHKPCEVVLAVGVSDEAGARAFVTRLLGKLAASRIQGATTSCESNEKNIGTALEMYSTDNSGRYPKNTRMLIPDYLRTIPTCPEAGSDTYSATYQSASNPDAYTFACGGDNHGRGANLPSYNSSQGLISGAENAPAAPPKAAAEETQIEGETAWVVGHGDAEAAVALHQGYLIIASGRDALGRTLQAMNAKTSGLATDPLFQDARKHMPGNYGLFSYVSLQQLVNPLTMARAAASGAADLQTLQAMQAIRYVVSSSDIRDNDLETQSFLKLDPLTTSPLIKTVLTQPGNDFTAAHYMPAQDGLCLTGNLSWIYPVVLQSMQAFPGSRDVATRFPDQVKAATGLDVDKDLMGATTGGIAVSSNVLGKVPMLLQQMITSGRPAPSTPVLKCASNEKNLGTALEMYSTDNSGRYPTTMALLVPNYLKTIPTCPSAGKDTYSGTFVSKSNPDDYTFYCAGNNHSDEGQSANFPRYTSTQGLEMAEVTRPEPPPAERPVPAVLIALHLKSAEAGTALMQQVETRIGRPSEVSGKIGEIDVHTYKDALPLAWAIVPGGEPVLLLAAGPDAQGMLKTGFDAAANHTSVADLPAWQALMARHPNGVILADYLNLQPLVNSSADMVRAFAKSNPPPEQMRGMVDAAVALLQQFGSWLHGTSALRVEEDGVRFTNRGTLSLTSLSATTALSVSITAYQRQQAQAAYMRQAITERQLQIEAMQAALAKLPELRKERAALYAQLDALNKKKAALQRGRH